MLAIQKQNKHFSKVMTGPNGVPVLVFFELVERNGHLIAKALYFKEIDSQIQNHQFVALPVSHEIVSIQPLIKSPFSYLTFFAKDLHFFTSQMARAPSFA